MNEIDFLMEIEPQGVKTYTGITAIAAQLREWLATPKGSIWGRPSWGNNLSQFRHMPMNDDTAAMIESYLVLAIANDLPQIIVDGIRVIPISIDLYKLNVDVSNTRITEDLAL